MKLKFCFLALGLSLAFVFTISCGNHSWEKWEELLFSSSSEEEDYYSSSSIHSYSSIPSSSSSFNFIVKSSSSSSIAKNSSSSSITKSSNSVEVPKSSSSSSIAESSSSVEMSKITEIKMKWQQYKPKNVTTVFLEMPSVTNPYRAGALTTEFLDNGLNMFKFVRYLAGLSENIVYTDELNDLGQHGAVILAALGKLTHEPSKPSDMDDAFFEQAYKSTKTSNIHMSTAKSGTLEEAVKSFCNDSDEGNIDRLGHRRWMLNPPLGKVGFGYATSSAGNFIPIQVFDKSNTEKIDVEYVLWPNKGYFPTSFFKTTQAWNVSLNSKSYNLSKCKPTVKLTSLDDGKVWTFSTSDNDKKGKYFNVETSGYGMPYSVIFRPDGISSFDSNKRFKVEIEGLVDKSDKAQKIEYEVEFFTLQ